MDATNAQQADRNLIAMFGEGVDGQTYNTNKSSNNYLSNIRNEVYGPRSNPILLGNEYEASVSTVEINRIKSVGYTKAQYYIRDYLAEFLGTLILVLIGDGTVAQAVLNPSAVGSAYLTINIGYGLALAFAVYVTGPVSGAHLNPAITIANTLLRNFPISKVPGYIASQMLGAFVGAALVMATNFPAIIAYDSGTRQTEGKFTTAGIFATYPSPYTPNYAALICEIISTALLLIGILGITDPRHETPTWLAPISVGGVLSVIGMSTGWLTGFALNPARDLGPRIFTMVAGWGTAPFTAHDYYFWVPIVGPIVGAIVGVLLYDALISPPFPDVTYRSKADEANEAFQV